MVNVISNIVDDKQDVKNQLGGTPNVIKVPFRFQETITPKHVVTKQIKRTYSGSNVFLLNSANFGVLGTNKLGNSASTDTLYSVLPHNNIYVEYFAQSDYINTANSTGTLNTANESYTLNTGEILESEVICKLRTPINTVKILDHEDLIDIGVGMILPFTLGSDTFGSDTVSIEFSNDSGTTWFSGNENQTYTFGTSTNNDELKYRITNVSVSVIIIDKPLYITVNQ